MENILHILNGDAMLEGFDDSGLDGDTLVWREVFSEGPLLSDVGSAAFWRSRSAWICKGFDETEDDYQVKVLNQLSKLNEAYSEIDLWFEFDLHCQVNLLGVMMLLKQRTDLSRPQVNLICPAEIENMPEFRGTGELDGDQLAGLFDERVSLSPYDFELAAEAWAAYVQQDAQALSNFIENTSFWGNMPLLKTAMQAQLKRLQRDRNGLNYIEQTLLNFYHTGLQQRQDIYTAFWNSEKIYGMGDAEIDIYLSHLEEKGLIKL